jgi:hypothetical protein
VPGLSGRHSVGGRFRPTLTTYTCWLKGSCKAKLRPRRGGAFVEDSRRQLNGTMEDSTAIVLQGTWIIAFLLAAFVIGWFIGRDISLQPT